MSRKHALLSASGANKWLNCTPSAVLESTIESQSSVYADEGTLAHDIAENNLKYYFGFIDEEEWRATCEEIEQNEHYNASMLEYTTEYFNYCVGEVNRFCKMPLICIEEQVSLEPYIKDGFSHLDFMLIGNVGTDDVLHIIDYKHGKGVPVKAENNKQALIYALGGYLKYGFLFNIQTVEITVYQPRIDNVTQWWLSVNQLMQWAEEELKPKAQIAYEGKGDFKPGEWCRFCKAKPNCRAFAARNLKTAMLDFESLPIAEDIVYENSKMNILLTDEEIANIVRAAPIMKNWLEGVLDFALKQAIHNNKQYPGLKLVHGRSMRRYTDKNKIAEVLKVCGYKNDEIFNNELKALTEIEKLLGKTKLNKLIGKYITKPEGKLSLVPADDNREEFNSLQDAIDDFK